MTILGYILIGIGSFWVIGRLLNQKEMLNRFFVNKSKQGLLYGIKMYLRTELFLGIGFGTGLIVFGKYLID